MSELRTRHVLRAGDARDGVGGTVALVVTSPPYPMVEMWDGTFAAMDPAVGEALAAGRAWEAWEGMHRCLDTVWARVAEVVTPGGFVCVNVGDAVRTVGGEFALHPNHARVTTAMLRLGLTPLPDVLWRKPTNAPNKFMGSGMLPAGAYVTYEHEYVGIYRKGGKRAFGVEEREARRRSAYFWEERNTWFSDIWADLPGARQGAAGAAARDRSAAFPLELPFRLVNMYSLLGDTVLDPFGGLGTTALAALAAGRSSVGVELDPVAAEAAARRVSEGAEEGRARQRRRLTGHADFVRARAAEGKAPGHHHAAWDLPVTTGQEEAMELWEPATVGTPRQAGPEWVVEATHRRVERARGLFG